MVKYAGVADFLADSGVSASQLCMARTTEALRVTLSVSQSETCNAVFGTAIPKEMIYHPNALGIRVSADHYDLRGILSRECDSNGTTYRFLVKI